MHVLKVGLFSRDLSRNFYRQPVLTFCVSFLAAPRQETGGSILFRAIHEHDHRWLANLLELELATSCKFAPANSQTRQFFVCCSGFYASWEAIYDNLGPACLVLLLKLKAEYFDYLL